MPILKHTHKYVLSNLGTKIKPRKVYTCALPGCSHYLPIKKMVIGKTGICWQCDSEFTITADISRKSIVKPRCLKCRGKLGTTELDDKLDRTLEMIMGAKL